MTTLSANPPAASIAERRRNRPDAVLLSSVFALSGFGLLMIYSATRLARELNQQLASVDMERQMIFFTAGTIAMLVFSVIDYRELRHLFPIIYGLTIVALLAVFAFPPINGARRWIPMGPFAFQPAEFAKIVAIIGIASILSRGRVADGLPWRIVATATGLLAIPAYLILSEPDLGTTMTFPFILLAMLFAGGLRGKQLMWIGAAGVTLVTAVLQFDFLAQHQKDRLAVFLNPELDPQGIGFQLSQAKQAIGSGQFIGKGLFEGTQTPVPEQETDFIFTAVGEQFGFVGGVLVLAVFLIILWRLLVVAANARDRFGSMLAVGIAATIAFHVFVNIGMTIGIAPVTGVPLPFISQGGSFYLAMSIAIGIANSIWLRRSPVPGETYIV